MQPCDDEICHDVQALFREVNERVRECNSRSGRSIRVTDFVCECADPECSERLTLSLAAFERIREQPERFVVRSGHEQAGRARVVEEHEGLVVVERMRDGGPALVEARAAA